MVGTNQGTYLITLSTRTDSPQMTVTTIVPPSSNSPIFGYYSDDTYTYFGLVSPSFNGRSTITVLEQTGITVGKLSQVETAPSGWTTFTNVKQIANLNSNVASATKATQDKNGKDITLSYVKVYGSSTNSTNSETITPIDLANQNYAMGMIRSATDNPTGKTSWNHIISMNWTESNKIAWVSQIAVATEQGTGMYYRTDKNNITGKAWTRVLDSSNYSSYVPMTHSGTTTPANTLGKNGDIYVLLDS